MLAKSFGNGLVHQAWVTSFKNSNFQSQKTDEFGAADYQRGEKKSKIRKYLQTMCMSLGTEMGISNIKGVASAIIIGDGGAVFWMWVSAFFGMATALAENHLLAKYSDDDLKGR